MKVIGRYVMLDALAAGGMATVHLGRLVGPAGFARTVAMKMLRSAIGMGDKVIDELRDEEEPA